MGIFQDTFKKFFKPLIDDAVGQLQKADVPPKVTEVPSAMQIGYQFTGGARRKYGSNIDFDSLRQFSVVYDVARACINHRKRQINNLEWSIIPKDDEAEPEKFKKRIDEVTAFFEEPVKGTDFKTWIDRVLEDILVIDAGVVWKDKTFGGKLLGLLPVDGSTIRLKVEQDGTTPEPPEMAYQQIIYGEVHGEYTTDEMYYKIMNPRTNTPYGLSPLECLVIGVDAALRSQIYNASLLSEGTTPEGFLSLPESWTPDQIKDYQMWFDTMLAGNFQQNTRIKMIPGGKGIGYIPTKKAEDMRMIEFEKWLLMKCCALFDVQPSDIGFMDGIGNNTGQEQQELGNQRGLIPMANFMKSFFTKIIGNDFGYTDLKFEWKGLQVVDNTFELERSAKMLEHGAMTINEMRLDQGREPFKDPAADKPMIYATGGPIPLDAIEDYMAPEPSNPSKEPTAPGAVNEGDNAGDSGDSSKSTNEIGELEQWEAKVLNYMKRGKGLPKFKSEFIDAPVQVLINARLAVAKSKEEVRVAFAPFKEEATERSLIGEALKVSKKISNHKRHKYERFGSRT